MCLDTVDTVTRNKRTGYKVMKKVDDTHVMGIIYGEAIPIGEWVKDKKRGMIKNRWAGYSYRKGYPKGFHVFSALQGARNYTSRYAVYKVRMREVKASGTQEGYRVTVCREIFIGEEVV